MNPHVVEAVGRCQLDQRDEVSIVRVNAAVRHQPHEVQRAAARPDAAEQIGDRSVLAERAVSDDAADTLDILVHHPTAAEVHVANV